MTDQVQKAVQYLKNADGILVTAGAGMGVDSGLPDFRGNDGFWKAYPALGMHKIPFTAIANGLAFQRNPERAWGFYGHRLDLYRKITPHAGFHIIRDFMVKKKHGGFVYTSNVDGQFQKAGFSSSAIVECHGSIHHLQCLRDCTNHIWSAQGLHVDVDLSQCRLTSDMPACPNCGGPARPNILMFNDSYWNSSRSDEQEVKLSTWLNSVENLVVIEIGAGVAIPTVRRRGELLKCPLIRLNPTASQVHEPYHVSLEVGALAGLTTLWQAYSNK